MSQPKPATVAHSVSVSDLTTRLLQGVRSLGAPVPNKEHDTAMNKLQDRFKSASELVSALEGQVRVLLNSLAIAEKVEAMP